MENPIGIWILTRPSLELKGLILELGEEFEITSLPTGSDNTVEIKAQNKTTTTRLAVIQTCAEKKHI